MVKDSMSEICKVCGMCCDGTLFNKASIKDEADESLVKTLGLATFTEETGKRFFRLPCHHFDKCCTIYDQTRPIICGGYFCKPLVDAQKGSITLGEAKEIINKTLQYRAEVLVLASKIESYQSFNIHELIKEIHPQPTDCLKQHKELWLKLIGLIGQ